MKTKITTSIIFFFLYTVASFSQASKPSESGYAPVNGLKVYYEVYGAGQPLVLLHGAFNTINTAFSAIIPELSKNRKVIAVELQGHGRTADIDRPFSFENMADDVVELLKYLKQDKADILGYSMGGAVTMQVAIRHPEVVHKIVIISAAFKYEGWSPETRAILPTLTPGMFEGTPIKQGYDQLAPDPKHWPQFVEKMKKFITTPFDYSGQIKTVKLPAMVIAGDGDGVLPEHVVELFRSLGGKMMPEFSAPPNTQMAIFPGTSHIGVMMHPDWLLAMIPPFLDAPVQKASQ